MVFQTLFTMLPSPTRPMTPQHHHYTSRSVNSTNRATQHFSWSFLDCTNSIMQVQKHRLASLSLSKNERNADLHLKPDKLILISDLWERLSHTLFCECKTHFTSSQPVCRVFPNGHYHCFTQALLQVIQLQKTEASHSWNKPEKWPSPTDQHMPISCVDAYNNFKVGIIGTIISNLQNQKLRVSWGNGLTKQISEDQTYLLCQE